MKPILFLAAALAVIFWLGHAKAAEIVPTDETPVAQEPAVKMGSAPVVCVLDTEWKKGTGNMIEVWQGLTQGKIRTILWQIIGTKDWIITLEKAGNPLVCVISAGDESAFIGEDM